LLTVLHKVGVPKSNIARIWTPTFEWYEVRCGSRNRHQKDMCLKEIRLRAQNLLIFLGSVVNMIEGSCMTITDHESLHFDNELDIHMSSENYEANDYGHNLDLLIISH
jgi:hypothetical protein